MEFHLLDTRLQSARHGDERLLEHWTKEPGTVAWLHLTGEMTDAQELLLRERFDLHPLALQDAKRNRHPPKLELFENSTFILLKALSQESDDIHFSTIQLAIFVGETFIVTRTSGASRAVARLKEEVTTDPARFVKGSGAMATRLIRLIIDRYLTLLLGIEPRLEELEDGLLSQTGDEILAELTGYKTELKKFRRIFLYHEQILARLKQKPCAGFPSEQKHELNDVYEQQERAGSLTLLYYELASDLNDGYLAMFSHRLNRIMQVLTIVTVVFVPLSFLAGIYGMNFDHMPELHSRWGYFILLSIMGAVAATLLWVFRKRRWL
ncbi:MAG: magnesium/cobalt transporter CorA [Prosthecobacter sp.]